MFFNEASLYLEADEPATPMTDDEIQEAVEEAEATTGETTEEVAASESAEFILIAEQANGLLNEEWYNLREKMMNIEHIAILKEHDGLYSESEMLLEASFADIKEKTIEFFRKAKNLIKNLFNRFIQFITGLTVKVRDIEALSNGELDAVWKDYHDKYPKKQYVNVLTWKSTDILNASTVAGNAVTIATKAAQDVTDALKKVKKKDDVKTFKEVCARANSFRAKSYSKSKSVIEGMILNGIYVDHAAVTTGSLLTHRTHEPGGNTGGNFGNDQATRVGMKEVELTKELFKEAVITVKNYKKLIAEARKAKDMCDRAIDAEVKNIRNMNLGQYAAQCEAAAISEIRWVGTISSKVFSRLTACLSKAGRQSIAIARRVLAGSKQQHAKKTRERMMSDSYDFVSAYFAD